MADTITLKLSDQHVLTISDDSNGITLKTSAGAKIVVNSEGITLDNGKGAKITLQGPTVDINGGALSVT